MSRARRKRRYRERRRLKRFVKRPVASALLKQVSEIMALAINDMLHLLDQSRLDTSNDLDAIAELIGGTRS